MSAEHCAPAGPRTNARDARADGPPFVVLVGRPNSGKSSLFNRVTGGSAHVGNFPGITVDILEQRVEIPGRGPATMVDLPGFYTLGVETDPDTDEGVARSFLAQAAAGAGPVVIVQVLDATNIALGLRLTRELLTREQPLLVAATQCDLLAREGHEVDAEGLSRALGVPVIAVSARDPAARERVLASVSALLDGQGRRSEGEAGWDPDEVAARFVRSKESTPKGGSRPTRRPSFTERADAILLHPLLGPVLFLGLMAGLFAAVFSVADPASQLLDTGIGWLSGWVTRALGDGLLASFLSDGVLGGAGTVLAFLPQIVILTVAMELLEASGYLARGAFLVDRLLRAVGLGGRAFVPLLTAHACAVPAIAATRILRDPRERLSVILVLPLMACSARLPTYGLLIASFFSDRSPLFRALVFVALYFAGIASGLVASFVIRRTVNRGRSLPLVLEMPQYRAPQTADVARATYRSSSRFVREVGTVILAASVVLWGLLTVPRPGAHDDPALHNAPARVVRLHRSVAAGVGAALEPVTRPAGFDWRINVGLIASFGARELMVGTMGIIFGIEDAGDDPGPLAPRIREARRPDGTRAYGPRTGLALMAFFVLACQCMSTVAAMRRETRGWKWPAFVLGYTYAAGYLAAVIVYQVGGLIGLS